MSSTPSINTNSEKKADENTSSSSIPCTTSASTPASHPPSQSQPDPSNPKLRSLQSQITNLSTDIANTKKELSKTLSELSDHLPRATTTTNTETTATDETLLNKATKITKRHITLLHRYNEIKDVGMGLLGLIADRDGKRVVEVMKERGVDSKD